MSACSHAWLWALELAHIHRHVYIVMAYVVVAYIYIHGRNAELLALIHRHVYPPGSSPNGMHSAAVLATPVTTYVTMTKMCVWLELVASSSSAHSAVHGPFSNLSMRYDN